MDRIGVGHALVDRQMTAAVRTLWEGDLSPIALEAIEFGLRALLVSRTLSLSPVANPWHAGDEHKQQMSWTEPFGDSHLDYEFQGAFDMVPRVPLHETESGYLENFIEENLTRQAKAALPTWITRVGEALAFLDAWYGGHELKECEQWAKAMDG